MNIEDLTMNLINSVIQEHHSIYHMTIKSV